MHGWRRFFVCIGTSINFSLAVTGAFAQTSNPGSEPSPQSPVTSPPAAGNVAPQNEVQPKRPETLLRLNAVRLRILFDVRLFDAVSEKQQLEQLGTFCRVWQEAFLREKGPWGFGIASEVSCNVLKPETAGAHKAKESFDTWTLTVEKTAIASKDVIQARLCRPDLSAVKPEETAADESEQRCEAKKSFPWSEFRLRFVRHRAFVRLLVASLYDQLPLYAAVSRNIVRFDRLRIEGFPEPSTPEVLYPPPPQNLIFVEARFDPRLNRFRLKEIGQKDAILLTMSQMGTVWIVSRDGRGSRNLEFTKNIESAYMALASIFQLDQLKFEKKVVESVANTLLDRASLSFFLRADGLIAAPLMSQQSGIGGSATLGWRLRSRYLVTLGSSYVSSTFKVGTQVVEKDSLGASNGTANVNLKELDGWLAGNYVHTLRVGKVPPLDVSGGARVGYISGTGEFRAPGGLPEENLTLRSRSVGIGALLGLSFPLSSAFQLANASTIDFALATSSLTVKSALEWSWIISRIVTPGRPERPPGFQLGLAATFASLSRRFENNDSARKYKTDVTLNGFQTSLFVERAF
jgi:hypothetical protein